MHSSRNALKHSCSAHNAYNLAGALAKTFCSGRVRRQEALEQKPADKNAIGTFSSLESLSTQFGSRVREREQKERRIRFRYDQPYTQRDEEAATDTERNVFRKEEDEEHELVQEIQEEYRDIQRELTEESADDTAVQADDKAAPTGDTQIRKQPTRKQPHRIISEAELRAEDIWKKAKRGAPYQDPSDLWFNSAEHHVKRLAKHHDHRIMMQWIGERVNRLFLDSRVKKLSPGALMKLRRLFDYEPRTFKPVVADSVRRGAFRDSAVLPPAPWKSQTSAGRLGGMELLEVEIARFGAYIEPSPAEQEARAAVIEQTRDLVEEYMRRPMKHSKDNLRVDVFGSERTGLATATSDLDIRVHYIWPDPDEHRLPVQNRMRALCQYLDKSKDYILAVYRHGKFEIISCQHKASGIDIQIVNSPDTDASREWIRYYLDKLPHLRDLFFVIKTALSMRGLVDVFNGGIGSYGLFWMIVAALERRRSGPPPTTSAEQFRHFLEFYSTFDFTRYGLTISPTPKMFLKHDFATQQITHRGRSPIHGYITAARRRGDLVRAGQWSIGQTRPLQPYLFCLQDPADPVNDLGRKTNAIKHLQETIRDMKDKLEPHLLKMNYEGKRSPVNHPAGLLGLLVGRCDLVYEERRRRVEEFGEVVAEGSEEGGVEEGMLAREKIVEDEVGEGEGRAVGGEF